ncbi:MAG: peptidase M14, partial [Rhodothermales bacterium]|nr:peptidase M14 [Rhodothermales bacterium]
LSKDQPKKGQSARGQPAKGVPGEGAAHADAPVASYASAFEALSERCTLFVIPHINPDGEARNRRWMDRWPDVEAYMRYSVREKPGRDVEFSWPDRRPENAAAAAWLRRQVAAGGPMHMHASLHGMGYSDGVMLLIDRHWSYRTERLQSGFTRAAARAGLRMHDNNRKGEKGFFRIAPGFTTTPEGRAMRTYFESHGDPETAALFSDSSMEFVRSLGGDPLCIVTELPLFLVRGQAEPERPVAYMAFKERLPEIKLRLEQGRSAGDLCEPFGLDPLDIQIASALHLEALDLAVATVGSSSGR